MLCLPQWNRLGHFQDVTLRLIAERLLPPENRSKTYISREYAHLNVALAAPYMRNYRYHLYASKYNEGALEFTEELSAWLSARERAQREKETSTTHKSFTTKNFTTKSFVDRMGKGFSRSSRKSQERTSAGEADGVLVRPSFQQGIYSKLV